MVAVALYPDAELVAVTYLRTALAARAEAFTDDVEVFTDYKRGTNVARRVRLRRVGGAELHQVADSPRLQVQVGFDEDKPSSDKANRQALAQVVWALLRAMQGQSVPTPGWPVPVVCYRVATFGGPANLPDPADPGRTVTQLTVEVAMRGIAA